MPVQRGSLFSMGLRGPECCDRNKGHYKQTSSTLQICVDNCGHVLSSILRVAKCAEVKPAALEVVDAVLILDSRIPRFYIGAVVLLARATMSHPYPPVIQDPPGFAVDMVEPGG